jgi:hypothetical protein
VISAIGCSYFRRAFGWCVPIGCLGGLVGLGGGEFRLPVLVYGIGFGPRSAVPLNLLISLVTLGFSLAVRSGAVSLGAVARDIPQGAARLCPARSGSQDAGGQTVSVFALIGPSIIWRAAPFNLFSRFECMLQIYDNGTRKALKQCSDHRLMLLRP